MTRRGSIWHGINFLVFRRIPVLRFVPAFPDVASDPPASLTAGLRWPEANAAWVKDTPVSVALTRSRRKPRRVPLAVRSSRSEPVCASPIPTWLSPHPGERHLTFAGGTKCGMSSMRSDGAAALRQAPVGTSSALLKPSMTNDAAGGVTRDGTSDACIWIFRLVSTNPGQINLIYSLDSFPFRP